MQVEEQIDNRTGKPQILSNIRVLTQLSTYLRTTLGPYGLDKLLVNGSKLTVTNDRATIMRALRLKHPAARLVESVAYAQDEAIGDGTTSVVLLAVEVLKSLEDIIGRNEVIGIVETLDEILDFCLECLSESSFILEDAQEIEEKKVNSELEDNTGNGKIEDNTVQKNELNSSSKENSTNKEKYTDAKENKLNSGGKGENKNGNNKITTSDCLKNNNFPDSEYKKPTLELLATTALTSKILSADKHFFAEIIINALKATDKITIKKIKGGSFTDSFLFPGVAFEKCFTYAGYEQQPKKIKNAKILLTNVELEWKAERDNAEIKMDSVRDYASVVDAEYTIIRTKLDFAIKSGADVVLSSSAIGDYATQYFAEFGIFCAGRVAHSDLEKVKKSCGGKILSSMNLENLHKRNDNLIKNEKNPKSDDHEKKQEPNNDHEKIEENFTIDFENDFLGTSEYFEEKQIGNFRYNFIANPAGATILLRGPGDEILSEMERSINDAIQVTRKSYRKDSEVRLTTGGGSNEIALSVALRKQGREIGTKKMFVYFAISDALANLVGILVGNFGMDVMATIAKLKKKALAGHRHYGVALNEICIDDMRIVGVYEPLDVKRNVVMGAFEAAKCVLMIDSTVIVPSQRQQ